MDYFGIDGTRSIKERGRRGRTQLQGMGSGFSNESAPSSKLEGSMEPIGSTDRSASMDPYGMGIGRMAGQDRGVTPSVLPDRPIPYTSTVREDGGVWGRRRSGSGMPGVPGMPPRGRRHLFMQGMPGGRRPVPPVPPVPPAPPTASIPTPQPAPSTPTDPYAFQARRAPFQGGIMDSGGREEGQDEPSVYGLSPRFGRRR